MRPGDPIHARAILAAIVRQLEQGANLIQRKAEIPGTANERQPAKFGLPIVAVIRRRAGRSEEHTTELQSLMRISYAVFCSKHKTYDNDRKNLRSTARQQTQHNS